MDAYRNMTKSKRWLSKNLLLPLSETSTAVANTLFCTISRFIIYSYEVRSEYYSDCISESLDVKSSMLRNKYYRVKEAIS